MINESTERFGLVVSYVEVLDHNPLKTKVHNVMFEDVEEGRKFAKEHTTISKMLVKLEDHQLNITSDVTENENIVTIGDYEFHDTGTVMMTNRRRTIHETTILALKFHQDIIDGKINVSPHFGESSHCLAAFCRPRNKK